jgi:hypothetical protein
MTARRDGDTDVTTGRLRRHHRGTARDETGSMPLAVMLTLCALSLSTAMMSVTLAQVIDTRQTVTRGHARYAAQTGLQVAIAAVNAAHGADPAQGDRSLLPCGPIDGNAGAEAVASYRVTLTYYLDDPAVPLSAAMTCAGARTGPTVPHFVVLTSTGAASGGTPSRRTLQGNYPLRTATAPTVQPTWGPWFDEGVHPRLIPAWSPSGSSTSLCPDPGSGRPPAGQVVKMQNCEDGIADNGYKQFFYYRQDLTLSTVASLLAVKPMCLDAGATPAAGTKITMQPCVTPVPPQQRWYYNSFRNVEMASSTGPGPDDVTLSGMCLNVATPGVRGSDLVLGAGTNCHSATYNTRQTFSLYTKIGPGQAGSRPVDCTQAAGYPCTLTQLANYGMPSRCLEKYTTFMANIECVQDPDPTKIRWSQLWRLPKAADGPTGTIGPIVTVDPDGKTWCLTTATSFPYYVTQNACDPQNPTATQEFTHYRNTGNEFTMYRIVDSAGQCLTHPNRNDDNFSSNWVFYWNGDYNHWKSRVSRCINSTSDPAAKEAFYRQSVLSRQKWNAPFQLPTGPPETDPAPAPSPPTNNVPGIRHLTEISPP